MILLLYFAAVGGWAYAGKVFMRGVETRRAGIIERAVLRGKRLRNPWQEHVHQFRNMWALRTYYCALAVLSVPFASLAYMSRAWFNISILPAFFAAVAGFFGMIAAWCWIEFSNYEKSVPATAVEKAITYDPVPEMPAGIQRGSGGVESALIHADLFEHGDPTPTGYRR